MLFPLGEMQKRDVRAIAKREGIPTWAKKDSTGICFIGERPFREFLARYLPRTPGPMVTPEGVAVGRHEGLAYYTLGQRQGLGIGGTRDGGAEPWFVAGKDMAAQRAGRGAGPRPSAAVSRPVDATDLHWIGGAAPAADTLARLGAKTRYRMPDAPCTVTLGANGTGRTRRSPLRNGRPRPDSTWCCMKATYAWAAA